MADLVGFYGKALDQSQQNYGQVLAAYGAGQANLSSSMPGIAAGYSGLTNNVQGLMKQGYDLGLGDIQKQAAVNYGNVTQGLANRGLSNSTIWGNLANQASAQTQREVGGLAYNVANQAAERQQQVGLAGLAAQMQGLGLQTSLYGQQGNALAGYHFPLPGFGGGGGGGGSGHGGGGGYSSPLDNQMFPFGNPTPIASPGASGYSGGAGSAGIGGYSPYGTNPGGMNVGQSFNPSDPASYMGAGWSNGNYYDWQGNNYSTGQTYSGSEWGSGLGAGWENGNYYDF